MNKEDELIRLMIVQMLIAKKVYGMHRVHGLVEDVSKVLDKCKVQYKEEYRKATELER
jgi:hypothetical protein